MTFEHSMLRTATFSLIAIGAIMVYSASSGTTLLSDGGDSSYYLKRYLVSAAIGLVALAFFARRGLGGLRRLTPVLLALTLAGLVAVMLPGIGVEANGATRWIGVGPVQVQPSEVAKLALVLYAAALMAARPERTRSLRGMRPLLVVAGVMSALVVLEPDLGTAIVISLTLGALLVAGGMKIRHLLVLAGALALLALIFSLVEPYRRERLIAFLNPWADAEGGGFQSVQGMIAIGSGGPFGVGLGESVQKLFYLPEAHTDMILAVIGEELGFAGITAVLFLYGMIAYAGLRAARRARDLYSKLVATGITSMILTQAALNFFAVMGVLPLTGVPLPFISYGNSSLIVLLAAMGLLINVAQQGAAVSTRERRARARDRSAGSERSSRRRHLRVVRDGGEKPRKAARAGRERARVGARAGAIRRYGDVEDSDRRRRDRRARRPGARDRRRAAR